jgi:alpha-tubulin suppressor-like RCC1 family protein
MATTTIAATWYSPELTITDTRTALTINSTETVYFTSTTYNDSGTTIGRQLRFTGGHQNLANFKMWLTDTTDVLTSCTFDLGHNMAVLLENKNALVIPQTAKNALIYNPTTKAISKSVACSGYSDGVVRQGSVVLVPKNASTIKILDETGKQVSTTLQIQMPNPGPTVEYAFESATDTSGNNYVLSLPTGASIVSDFKTVKALQLSGDIVAETPVLTSLAETNGGNDYYLLNNNTISFDIYLSAATGTSTSNTTGINILSIGIDNGNSATTNLGGTPYGYKFSYFSNTLNYTIYGNDGAGTKMGVSTYGGAVSTGRWIHYDIVWGTSHRPTVYQDGSPLTTVVPVYTGTITNNLRLKHTIGNKTFRFHGSSVTGHRFANFRMYQRQLSATERNSLQSFPSVLNGYSGYSGGALTSDNNVVLAPAFANTIAVVSPTNVVSFVTPVIAPFISTDTTFNSSKYSGAVTLQNGKIMLVPSNATRIGLVTLPAGTFAEDPVTIPTTPTYDKYSGGVLMMDGRVLLVPSGATTVGIYNPTITTPTFVNGPAATGYSGGSLLNDGRVILFPKTATKVAIYNPVSNSIIELANITNITDMLSLADNNLFVLQDKATSVSIYEPRDIKAIETDIIENGPAATGYKTQVRLTDDRIIFMNNTGTAATGVVAVYNPNNNKVFTQATNVSYINALPVSDGTFIQGPFNNTRVGRYTNVITGTVPAIKSTYPQQLYSKVFVKGRTSFFLTAENKLYACGNNGYGRFPILLDTSIITTSGAGTIIQVANGSSIDFILTSSRKVFYINNRQILEFDISVIQAANVGTIDEISARAGIILFLTSTGKVFECSNSNFTLVQVNTTNIGASGKIIQVAVGYINTVARGHRILLRDDGTVFTYGNNANGECGNGTTTTVTIPTAVVFSPSTIKISKICAGDTHSLFLTDDGKLYACGRNQNGQLGTSSVTNTANVLVPTLVITTNINPETDGAITQLAASGAHSLLLTSKTDQATNITTSKAYGWGKNDVGQLGLGNTTTAFIPTLMTTANLISANAGPITNVYASGAEGDQAFTTLFNSSTGMAFACGGNIDNVSGTLDTITSGAPTISTIPIRTFVSDLDGYFSGVLLNSGINSGKVLLVPTSKQSDVRILDTATNTTTIPATISLGGKISGFSRGITLYNGNILLVPSTTSRIGLYNPITDTLSQVANVNTYIRSSVNEYHSLFLRSDGKVFAVGLNDLGQLGTGGTANTSTPTMIDITHIGKYGVITKIATGSGYSNSYFLRSDGKAFGCGASGNTGSFSTGAALIPTPIDTTNIGPNSIIKDIFAEYRGVWFLRDDGKVFFAGYNAGGTIRGLGSASSSNIIVVPREIDTTNIGPNGKITQVAASHYLTYFLRSDGAVFRCNSPIPTRFTVGVSAGEDNIVKQIAYKVDLAIFLTADNKLFRCFGTNAIIDIPTTEFLTGGKTILKIAVGTLNAMVLRSDGKVFAIPTTYAGSTFAESGIGVSTTAVTTFTEIITTNIGTRPIIDISCGYYSAFFTRDDNTIFSCGRDTYGELGLKSVNTIVTIPTEVSPRVGYKHGVQLKDGRVVLFSDIDASVCIYTPDTDSVVFLPSNVAGSAYANATLLENGKIVLTPDSATTVGIYTPPKTTVIKNQAKVAGRLIMNNTISDPANTILNPQNSAKFIKWLTGITSVRYGSWWSSTTKPVFSVGATKTPTSTFTYAGSVLLKDGRVLFVPNATATSALIYTPLTNTIAASATGVTGFNFGVLLANGDVLLVPRTASGVRIYNPNTNAISAAIGTATGYCGGVLLPNKNVLLVPHSATTIVIYNTANASIQTTGITLTGGGGYIGGVLLSDGRVVFVPNSATTVGVYDSTSSILSQNITVPALATNDRYSGGVLLPDGRVLFVPYSATNIGIYDPFANKGRGSFTVGPVITPAGTVKYGGGVLLPDGRVLFIPFGARNVGIYDPITNVFTTPIMYDASAPTINSDLNADNKYWGGSLLPDGRVVMTPTSATKVGIVSGFPVPKSEMCYHPCFN